MINRLIGLGVVKGFRGGALVLMLLNVVSLWS